MKNNSIFWIYGALQSLALAALIFLIFNSLNMINGSNVIRLDTQILMSLLFPGFFLIVEYIIYSKR